MTRRIEKTVFISYRRRSYPTIIQTNFSSQQKRNRPHTLSFRRGTNRHADQSSPSGAALTGEAVSKW